MSGTPLQALAPVNEPRLWLRGFLHDQACKRLGINPDTFAPVKTATERAYEGTCE